MTRSPSPRSAAKRAISAPAEGGGNTTQRIVESITTAIVERRLMPGTKLAEQKIADIFKVSRTVVRQALNQLSRDKLVTLEPARGAFVAQPSVDEARQVFETFVDIKEQAIPSWLLQRAYGIVVIPHVVKAALTTMSEVAKAFPDQFPAGSEAGHETEASPKIWEAMDDFKAKAAKLGADADAVLAAGVPADQAAVGAALGTIGPNCGGCHEVYRVKK